MSDDSKGPRPEGTGGAAEGWANHAGHLGPDDFSGENPSVPPQEATRPPTGWPTAAPGTGHPGSVHPGSVFPGTVAPKPGRSSMLPWVVIGALLILVFILLGALNLRDYHLIQKGDLVHVRRGGWLPGTTRSLDPDSGVLASRYAPLRLEVGMQFSPRRFTEREDLDLGLVNLIVELLRPAIGRDDADRVEQLGGRLERFPTAAALLEGKHPRLMRELGLVRGRRAEKDALKAIGKAKDLYQRYRRHGGPAAEAAVKRLETAERLLMTPQSSDKQPHQDQPSGQAF